MEYLDVVDEKGRPTGRIVSREEAHEKGVRHRTSHVWLLRMKEGELQVLLQKRSDGKDSFPGCYDISSAGHIPAGEEPLPSALRELYEELGVSCRAEDLHYCGQRVIDFDREFRGKVFRDRQVSSIYILWLDREEDQFVLQEEEISRVRWIGFDDCLKAVAEDTIPHCIFMEELLTVKKAAETEIIGEAITKDH